MDGPTTVRLRPRSESHLLAFLAIAAAVCVSIATVKPWGDQAASPGPSAMTPTAGATAAVPSEPGQADIVVQQVYVGNGSDSCTANQYWYAVSGSPGPLSGRMQIAPLLICASASQQPVVWPPSPEPEASTPVELESSAP